MPLIPPFFARHRVLIAICTCMAIAGSGIPQVSYYFLRNKCLAHLHVCSPDDEINVIAFGWWPDASALGIYLANPGGTVQFPPNYTERIQSPLIVKSRTAIVFKGPATIRAHATITLERDSAIVCPPAADAPNSGNAACVIREADNANLPAVVDLRGVNAVLSNVTVEGNRLKNPRGGVNIKVVGLRSRLDHVTSIGAATDGIQVGDAAIRNGGAGSKFEYVMSQMNGRNGLLLQNVADIFISDSEFENNKHNGVSAWNAGAIRFVQNDLGGNSEDGIDICGIAWHTERKGACGSLVADHPNSDGWIIIGNQFGGNGEDDISIDGWDSRTSSYVSMYHVIDGNEFTGGALRPNDSYDAVKIQDSGINVISDNVCYPRDGKTLYRYGIAISQTASHRELPDVIAANQVFHPGVAGFAVVSNTKLSGNNSQGLTPSSPGIVRMGH